MKDSSPFCFFLALLLLLTAILFSAGSYDGPMYDHSAYTECKAQAEEPLYNGGILKNETPKMQLGIGNSSAGVYTPSFLLLNLKQGTIYCFSGWVKINGADSASIRASLSAESEKYNCIATVIAKSGCWSFLKGGFVLNSASNLSLLFFQSSDDRDLSIEITSSSLQAFTEQQWSTNQQYIINTVRKRATTIHVADKHGNRLQGASIKIEQTSKEFPFGSAISKTILGNLPYQEWFIKRFNAAVFENELKWYATEPKQSELNYTNSDLMLEFIRANQIIVRGHNIFWEDPIYTPSWVRNLTSVNLQSAVNSRIQSLMRKYSEEFIHWDVSNEMLHFDFYEQRLGKDATLQFFKTAHEADPLATLFMNDFNVVETCIDVNSTVDAYILRLKELRKGGVYMDGIGLEGHFDVPNPPFIRGVIDKLATLGLPIWLTEIDISKKHDKFTQAKYLELVLREVFSHPSIDGIMLWTALHPNGCYQMCLTDTDFRNLPSGDVVDKLLEEWKNGEAESKTDEHGSYSFFGFLGEYKINVKYGDRSVNSSFSLSQSDETKHFSIQL